MNCDTTSHRFDVKTASICTTELWDALKSFILTSFKIKVAPYPIIVSLDTFMLFFSGIRQLPKKKKKRKGGEGGSD